MTDEQFEKLLAEQKLTNHLLNALLPVLLNIQKQSESLNNVMAIRSIV
jgi:hypothetical protein